MNSLKFSIQTHDLIELILVYLNNVVTAMEIHQDMQAIALQYISHCGGYYQRPIY
jgi:hypothetical protein